jgi:cytochrome c oxidase subunit IV
MSDTDQKNHISSYRSHLVVLGALILLTILTVSITSIQLGALNTSAAMLIASIKVAIVLLYFMHLKFDQKVFRFMVTVVLAIYAIVIIITFFDYLYR